MATKPGLYANIHAKQERIKREKAEGKPVEKMRKVGVKGCLLYTSPSPRD